MKVKLKADYRVLHRAGEIVEVSPETAGYLFSTGSAEPTEEKEKPAKKTAAKKD